MNLVLALVACFAVSLASTDSDVKARGQYSTVSIYRDPSHRKLLSSEREEPDRCRPNSAYYFERERGLACKDENVVIFRDVSRTTCEGQCSCRSWCVAYTYNRRNDDCYLKRTCNNRRSVDSDESGFKRLRSTSNVQRTTSSVQRSTTIDVSSDTPESEAKESSSLCPPRNDHPTFDRNEMWACKDDNIEIFRGVSEATCATQCACRSWCTAYTYNDRQECYLKQDCRPGDGEYNPRGDVTGFKQARSAEARPAAGPRPTAVRYVPLQNSRCTGAQQLQVSFVSSINACRDLCTNNGQCVAFEVGIQGSICRLLSSCQEPIFANGFTTEVKEGYNPPLPQQPPQQPSWQQPQQPFQQPPQQPFQQLPQQPPQQPPQQQPQGQQQQQQLQQPPPQQPFPAAQQRQRGCDQGLPFGLGNCICEGKFNGGDVVNQLCAELRSRCGAEATAFSGGLLQQVQRTCDRLSAEACVTSALMEIQQHPDCLGLINQGGRTCSRAEASSYATRRILEMCAPLS
uniref:Apple domain-containing protein n=1 Tax=Tetraselmis sp. GSL018 TaxID=582737 RepID=A0A061QSD4_9CHLO